MTTSDRGRPQIGDYAYVHPHGRVWGSYLPVHRGEIVRVEPGSVPASDTLRVLVRFDDIPEEAGEPMQEFYADEIERYTRRQKDAA